MQAPRPATVSRYARVLLSCILLLAGQDISAHTLDHQISRLWKSYRDIREDSLQRRINTLFEIRQGYRLTAQHVAEDSVTELLTEEARLSGNEGLIIDVYNRWFNSLGDYGQQPTPFKDSQKVAGYARTMMNIARSSSRADWLAMAWAAQGRCLMARSDFIAAGEAMNKAYYNASLIEDDTSRVSYMLLMGYCEYKRNAKLESFRHYMDALYLAKKTGNAGLTISCYEKLFNFYDAIGNHDKAETYLFKIFPLVLAQKPVDSTLLMTHYDNLALLQFGMKQYRQGVATSRKIIDYSLRTNNQYLKRRIFMLVKSMLTEGNQFALLADVYQKYYPSEVEIIRAQGEPILYYQLMAAFCESRGQKDSSVHYYELAKNAILKAGRPPNILAFFYRRYGQALLRFERPKDAVLLLDTALKSSEQIQYLPYMAELSGSLDTLYASLGKMDAAYRYAKLNQDYGTALARANRQDEVLMLDLENEIRSRELFARQEEERTEHRHNIQYMAITLLIGFTFLLLMLLGSFKVPRWAITAMGFFAFIFLFEFIILLIDHKLHELTHGEPWKILAIKIVIIAGMMPFHHWLEHKVVHYLHHHSLIDPSRISPLAILRRARAMMTPAPKPVARKKKAVKGKAQGSSLS